MPDTSLPPTPDVQTLITEIYAAFNRRDIDGALAFMSERVSWPRASEGGQVIGKDEIRAYWTRQWAQFDPHVDPLDITETAPGIALVRVHQLVRTLSGDLLSDSEVNHRYTLSNGLIDRMDLATEDDAPLTDPSAAFGKH